MKIMTFVNLHAKLAAGPPWRPRTASPLHSGIRIGGLLSKVLYARDCFVHLNRNLLAHIRFNV